MSLTLLRSEIVFTRFKLGEKMCEKIDELYHLATEYLNYNVLVQWLL